MSTVDLHDKACELLSEQLFKKTRNREKAEKAIKLIEEHNLTDFCHYSRGLVCFPDLLKIFLDVHSKNDCSIDDENIACMIARCIESDDESFSLNERKESMKHIFVYKDTKIISLKLLRDKYVFNDELYKYAFDNYVWDLHYENYLQGGVIPYFYNTTVEKETEGKYSGYRDSYHCLLYGESKHLHALIWRWKEWGDDCTADAARDFFGLAKECPLEIVMGRVELKIKDMY